MIIVLLIGDNCCVCYDFKESEHHHSTMSPMGGTHLSLKTDRDYPRKDKGFSLDDRACQMIQSMPHHGLHHAIQYTAKEKVAT